MNPMRALVPLLLLLLAVAAVLAQEAGIPMMPDSLELAAQATDATTTEAAAAAASTALDAGGQAALSRHNILRRRHQVPELTWSASLAARAAAWASKCRFESDPAANDGENVYASGATSDDTAATLKAAVEVWYAPASRYNYSAPGFSADTGTFTQVVWRASKSLGCAAHVCRPLAGTPWPAATLVVCRYSPPGNSGSFADNVLQPGRASPPPSSPPTTPPGQQHAGSNKFGRALTRINSLRARHQAPALAWSPALAKDASQRAAKCLLESAPGMNVYARGLATGSSPAPLAAMLAAVDKWYSAASNYNFSSPGFSSSTGSFTQLVWRSTTSVGCAAVHCSKGLAAWPQGELVVCTFAPLGNVAGEFKENVLRPKSSSTARRHVAP